MVSSVLYAPTGICLCLAGIAHLSFPPSLRPSPLSPHKKSLMTQSANRSRLQQEQDQRLWGNMFLADAVVIVVVVYVVVVVVVVVFDVAAVVLGVPKIQSL